MRKLLLISFIVSLLSIDLVAQQIPYYSQYTLNRFAINPALAGIIPCGELTTGSRKQWTGFEGAPETIFGSFHTRVNQDDAFPTNFHGWGVDIISDRAGLTDYIYFKGAYAYHLKLNYDYRLSFGVFVGVHKITINQDEIRVANRGGDPALNKNEASAIINPEISPGVFFTTRSFMLESQCYK